MHDKQCITGIIASSVSAAKEGEVYFYILDCSSV